MAIPKSAPNSSAGAGSSWKHIFDAAFRYKPSFDTDVRKTFEKIRKQQAQALEQPHPEGRLNVLPYWKYIQL